MQLIERRDDREYWIERIAAPSAIRSPFAGAPYVCLLWAGRGATDAERVAAAEVLVDSNCVYAVCGGLDCERWHDDIDEVARLRDRFLMTTWHEDEAIDEVAWFFVNATYADEGACNRFLVVVVDETPGGESTVATAIRQAFPGAPAV